LPSAARSFEGRGKLKREPLTGREFRGRTYAGAFFNVFSSVDRIIAATGFVRLLAGSQRRGSAVSRAPYSRLPGELQEHLRATPNSSVC
jgi:hypothetical protein